MSPKKEKPKANTNVTLEEYQQSYRSGCRYVVPEGQYARRICNNTIHDRVLHLCEEHSREHPSSRM